MRALYLFLLFHDLGSGVPSVFVEPSSRGLNPSGLDLQAVDFVSKAKAHSLYAHILWSNGLIRPAAECSVGLSYVRSIGLDRSTEFAAPRGRAAFGRSILAPLADGL